MGRHQPNLFCAAVVLLAVCNISAASAACVHQARVSSFSNASALNSGACGYGSMAVGFYGGRIAAAAPKLFKDGAACGACFQLRCNDPSVCKKEGTTVLVTDVNSNSDNDFVISSRALNAMAPPPAGKKGQPQHLHSLIDILAQVEYHRVPCDEYKTKNLAIRVEESSQKPNRLAIKFLYLAGQTEIVAVDVAQAGSSSNWMYMSRKQGGAIWETSGAPPGGALQFRFVVTAGYDGKWYWAKKVLPSEWKKGAIYDTGLQVTDIAQDGGCSDDHTTHYLVPSPSFL